MDCTVHGILQARILEWVAFLFSRGSSQPRDQTQVSRIAGGFFTSWARMEVHKEFKIPAKAKKKELIKQVGWFGNDSYAKKHQKCFDLFCHVNYRNVSSGIEI